MTKRDTAMIEGYKEMYGRDPVKLGTVIHQSLQAQLQADPPTVNIWLTDASRKETLEAAIPQLIPGCEVCIDVDEELELPEVQTAHRVDLVEVRAIITDLTGKECQ